MEAINKHTDPPPIKVRDKAVTHGRSGVSRDKEAVFPACLLSVYDVPLFEAEGAELTMLQSQIYVSGYYSIDNDLKRIRKDAGALQRPEAGTEQGMHLNKGDEASKRRFYRDLLVAEVQENFLNLNTWPIYRSFNLIEVKDFVDVLENISIHP